MTNARTMAGIGCKWIIAWLLLASSAWGAGIPTSIELGGNLESQTLIRHSSADDLQFVQNRNTLRVHAQWDWLKDGKLIERYAVPGIGASRLTLGYRGVYDSVYDAAPGDLQHGQERTDDAIGGALDDLSHSRRDDLKFENDLREAYIDLALRNLPVSFRFGRQQVIWGEADHFRLMDLWNPLDLRWHMHQEPSWDEIRVPLWLLKGTWNIGRVGPLTDVYSELVYNPGDYKPGIISGFLPRPWALPFPDPLRQGQVQYDAITRSRLTPALDLQGTSITQGDFHRNPLEASEVGLRLHATLPRGVDVTANYFYGRGRNIGAGLPFAVKIKSVDVPGLPGLGAQPVGTYQPDLDSSEVVNVYPANVKAEVVHPYLHVFGLTAKYFDEQLTGTSFRLETAYVLGSPYHTIETSKRVPTTIAGHEVPGLGLPLAPFGYTTRDIWAGMIGFDRATNILAINREGPWFFSGQVFWSYVVGDHVDLLRGNAGTSEAPYFGPLGRWVSGPYAGNVERQQDSAIPGNGDNIRRWEHLITLSATSFYWNNTLVPVIANLFDPVNMNYSLLWSVDYFVTNNLILTLRQSFYTDFGARVASNDPWFAGGRLHRRDETGIKITWQL